MDSISSTEQEIHRCNRCHRILRATASVTSGYGPGCRAVIRREAREHALDELNDKQRSKALEIVADGGVQRISDRVFLVIAGLGDQVYRTCVNGSCNCAWGLRRKSALTKPCAHVGAVRLFGVITRSSYGKAA